jgi:hypothetical protein
MCRIDSRLVSVLLGLQCLLTCVPAFAVARFFFGTPEQFEANAVSHLGSAFLDTDTFVVCYSDSGAAGQCRVGTVTGTTIAFGTEAQFDADVVLVANTAIGVCRLDTNKFAVAYMDDTDDDGYVVAASVSGTTITFGTPVEFSGNLDAEMVGCAMAATDKIIVGYNDEGTSDTGTGVACTATGTAFACGAVNDYAATDYMPFFNRPANLGTDKFVMPYSGQDAGGDAFVLVGTTSGNVITWGTVSTITTNSTSNTYACSPQDADRFVVVYNNETNTRGDAVAGTVSGTNITLSAAVDFNPTSEDVGSPGCTFISADRFVVSYPDASDGAQAKVSICDVDWTTPAITQCVTETIFSTSDALDLIAEDGQIIDLVDGYGTSEPKIILGYIDTAGTDDGNVVAALIQRRQTRIVDK